MICLINSRERGMRKMTLLWLILTRQLQVQKSYPVQMILLLWKHHESRVREDLVHYRRSRKELDLWGCSGLYGDPPDQNSPNTADLGLIVMRTLDI